MKSATSNNGVIGYFAKLDICVITELLRKHFPLNLSRAVMCYFSFLRKDQGVTVIKL